MGSCTTCGFLAAKRQVTGEEVDADMFFRQNGKPEHDTVFGYPFCTRYVRNIQEEAMGSGVAGRDNQVLHIIAPEYECLEWEEYIPGLSAKEHWERREMQRLREWQAERESADQEHRERMTQMYIDSQERISTTQHKFEERLAEREQEWRENDRQWRSQQEKDAEERSELRSQNAEVKADKRHTKELWIIGGVVTVVVVLGSLIAASIERGYFGPILSWEQ